jgi:hypothetical protein
VLTEESTKHDEIFQLDLDDFDGDSDVVAGNKKLSAYHIVQQGKKKKKHAGKENHDESHSHERNPIKLLLDVAKKWGVKGLAKRYDTNVCCFLVYLF